VESLADALSRTRAARAAAVAVDDGGIVEYAGDLDEVFELASVTKMLVAYAVLVAVEEGTVTLQQLAGPPAPPGATLRHLLAHASGLGGEESDGIVAQPGTQRIYSNAGFELLGRIVAEASGMAFEQYLAEAVFEPLGMDASSLTGSPARGGRSSCRDLARFATELLSPTLLAPETVAAATSVAFPGLAGVLPGFGPVRALDWGLGFEIRDGKQPHWTGAKNSPETFGHFGKSGTFCLVDPVERLGIVVLTDRPFGGRAKRAWPPLADGVIERHRS
jgi:CubicO group peptidase (beta-lactamase class C family)